MVSVTKCSLFVLSANGWKDYNMDSSFSRQRKPLYEEGIVRLANRVVVWLESEVSIDFSKVLGHEVFWPERSLNQPKATRVCIRSINQSNRSISVRLLFLFCSRVVISRSYENRSIFLVLEMHGLTRWALSILQWTMESRKVVLTFESVNKILLCDHSNDTS